MRFQVSCSKLLKHESYNPDTDRANYPSRCAKASLHLPAVSPRMAEWQSPSQVLGHACQLSADVLHTTLGVKWPQMLLWGQVHHWIAYIQVSCSALRNQLTAPL